MANALPTFPEFDVSETSTQAARWKKWLSRFETLLVAMNVTNKKRQRALLLHYAGEATNEIFDTLSNTTAGEGQDPFDKAVEALTNYFTPRQNREYETYVFRQAKKENNVSISAFHTRLRQLAITNEFADVDREIKTQIVQSCSSHKLRTNALENPSYTLTQLLDAGKAMELSKAQAANIEEKQSVHKLSSFGGNTACPAYQATCRACGKLSHFEAVCQSKGKRERRNAHQSTVNKVSENESTDDDEVYTFSLSTKTLKDQPLFKIKVHDTPVTIMADSGASINILDEKEYHKLPNRPSLEPSSVKIYGYQSKVPLRVLGKFSTTLESKTRKFNDRLYVVEGSGDSLISWKTSQELNLLQTVQQVTNLPSHPEAKAPADLLEEYDDLFHGLGKLKNYQIKLHIDEDIPPVAQPHRRVPFHNVIREALEGIDGGINISDDILVFGTTHSEHNQRLKAVFQRLREKGLSLKKSKREYTKDKLEFYGYVFPKDGISPDPKKVEDVVNLQTPSTASEPVTIYTDHKPLVSIYSNPSSKPPARVERWALRLQPHQITVKCLLRHPTKHAGETSRQQKVAEEYVSYLATTSTLKALKIQSIEEATQSDATLKAVAEAIAKGNWHHVVKHRCVDVEEFRLLERVKDELTVSASGNLILRTTRLLIPKSLHEHVVNLAHEGHQGLVKTKSLLREKVWFPNIDRLVEVRVKSCDACLVTTPECKREPLLMSPPPAAPWKEVSVDFAEIPNKEYLLLNTDDYSR
ncbi:uncharacterized protein [Montipora foliosa]|uniref:uncharacterized protein n=1 Tax=Montipora foliosa TaxID=591990 RepID=UPI0035F1BE42